MPRRICPCLLLCALIVLGSGLPPVSALSEFKKAFAKRYAGDGASEAFQKLVRKAGCNVCHIPGEKKDQHNPYGLALDELIPGNAEQRKKAAKEHGNEKEEVAKILAELEAAFDQVEKLEAAGGGTYGERIQQGKLPVDLPEKKK